MVPAVSIFARTIFCICLGKSWKSAVIASLQGLKTFGVWEMLDVADR